MLTIIGIDQVIETDDQGQTVELQRVKFEWNGERGVWLCYIAPEILADGDLVQQWMKRTLEREIKERNQ